MNFRYCFKYYIKAKIQKKLLEYVFPKQYKIVIASSGRSGSTMLTDAITDSLINSKFSKNTIFSNLIRGICSGYVERMETLEKESFLICKTHDLFVEKNSLNYKYIFVYGDPLESAISVERLVREMGEKWVNLHLQHLSGEGIYDDLFIKDVLNYRGQIISWLTTNLSNVYCVDYEDLWDHEDRISEFIGFKLELPQKILRKSKKIDRLINDQLFDELRVLKDTYKQNWLKNSIAAR